MFNAVQECPVVMLEQMSMTTASEPFPPRVKTSKWMRSIDDVYKEVKPGWCAFVTRVPIIVYYARVINARKQGSINVIMLKQMSIYLLLSLIISPSFAANGDYIDEGIGVFQPYVGYIMAAEDIPDISKEFTGLFKIGDNYCLRQTIVKLVKEYNDCLNDSTLALVPLVDDGSCLFLFSGFKVYNKGDLRAVVQKDKAAWPEQTIQFVFGSINYELKAKGNVEDNNISNYELSFASRGCTDKQIIVAIPLIEGTVVTILFVGDIDGMINRI